MRQDFDTEEWLKLRGLIVKKYNNTGFSPFSVLEINAIEKFLKDFPRHPGGYLLNGYVKWSKNEKKLANESFKVARDLLNNKEDWLKGLDIGINSLIQISNDRDILSPELFSVTLANLKMAKSSNLRSCDFAILVSCDENYFNIHGKAMLEYARREFSDCHVHVHLINPSDDTLTHLAKSHLQNLAVSYENTDIACRPYFATSRFLIASAVMDLYQSDIYILDVDIMPSLTFKNSIRRLRNQDFDLACPIMPKAWMPWNNYIACSVYIKNSANARILLNDISKYATNVYYQLNSFEHAWWVDQNALYWAITNGHARLINVNKFGRLIIGPDGTGKHDYSKLAGLFLESTDLEWRACSSFEDLTNYMVSCKSISPALLERIVDAYLHAHDINDTSILEYLLVLYFKRKLDKRFIDHLVAGLLKYKSYGLAASLINDSDGVHSYLPAYFSANLFAIHSKGENDSNKAIEKLSPVLNRKKYDLSHSILKDQYTGSNHEMTKAFYETSIRRLLRWGNIDTAVEEITNKFSKAIVVVGLQWSGTNFIASLLRENTQFYVPQSADMTLFWKHALPDEGGARVNPIFTSPVDALQQINALCLVVVKNPLLWIDTIVNRGFEDFFQTRKSYVASKNDIKGLASFYRKFVEKWAAAEGNVLFVSYEAILENPLRLFNTLNLNPINAEIQLPSKDSISDESSIIYKKNHIDKVISLTESQLAIIRTIIDHKFIKFMEDMVV